jgi:hypothetical protein
MVFLWCSIVLKGEPVVDSCGEPALGNQECLVLTVSQIILGTPQSTIETSLKPNCRILSEYNPGIHPSNTKLATLEDLFCDV